MKPAVSRETFSSIHLTAHSIPEHGGLRKVSKKGYLERGSTTDRGTAYDEWQPCGAPGTQRAGAKPYNQEGGNVRER
jgi:hypothetical protein